jgi:hypothetical protein
MASAVKAIQLEQAIQVQCNAIMRPDADWEVKNHGKFQNTTYFHPFLLPTQPSLTISLSSTLLNNAAILQLTAFIEKYRTGYDYNVLCDLYGMNIFRIIKVSKVKQLCLCDNTM